VHKGVFRRDGAFGAVSRRGWDLTVPAKDPRGGLGSLAGTAEAPPRIAPSGGDPHPQAP